MSDELRDTTRQPADRKGRELTTRHAAAAHHHIVRVKRDEANDELDRLTDLAVLREALDDQVGDLVRVLRANDVGWRRIGTVLGITGESCRTRYGRGLSNRIVR